MLRYRLVSGCIMIATLCTLVLWESRATGWLMLAVAGIVCFGGLRELFNMTKRLGADGFPILTAATGAIILSVAGAQGMMPFTDWISAIPGAIAAIGLLVVAGFIRVFNCADYRVGLARLAASAAGILYVVLPMACLLSIYLHEFPTRAGRALMLFLILSTKFGDIGGYTLGRISNGLMKNGNHKMVPRLSPGKSWEGFIGSLLFSGGIACLLNNVLGTWVDPEVGILFAMPVAASIGVALGAFGLVGDLAESVLKRASEVKDSGASIPGMGGVLDVIDSLLLVAPPFWVFICISG